MVQELRLGSDRSIGSSAHLMWEAYKVPHDGEMRLSQPRPVLPPAHMRVRPLHTSFRAFFRDHQRHCQHFLAPSQRRAGSTRW